MQASTFAKWHPITRDFGLIDATIEACCDEFGAWWQELGHEVTSQPVTGSLDDVFNELTPLSSQLNNTLFLPTISQRTAFFQNGLQGSDPSTAMPVLAARLYTQTMRICSTQPTEAYPAVIWEVYDPAATKRKFRSKYDNTQRSICAANDGGRWTFDQFGEPFPFEKLDRYSSRRKRDRFDHDLLVEYLSHFGIDEPGDQLFASGDALNGTKFHMPYSDGFNTYSLDEVLDGVPWQQGHPNALD